MLPIFQELRSIHCILQLASDLDYIVLFYPKLKTVFISSTVT